MPHSGWQGCKQSCSPAQAKDLGGQKGARRLLTAMKANSSLGCINRSMVRRSREAVISLSSAFQVDHICNTKSSATGMFINKRDQQQCTKI